MSNYLIKYNDNTLDTITAKSYYIHTASGRLFFYGEQDEILLVINGMAWKSVAKYFEVKEDG